ncbi:MAG: HAMP domain-containing protein [Pyrinomonadaceae bacterium]|nr:HAMP domain-containing protein [Pyrinomonadaceae bacterium]
MSLFWKISLWFLLAMALITGVSVFVSWTTQSEPFNERWKTMVANTMNVYTQTAKQIYDNEGEKGVQRFLKIIGDSHQNRDVCLATEKNPSCFSDSSEKVQNAIVKAFQSDKVEFESGNADDNYSAKSFTNAKGERFVVVVKTEFPRVPTPFGADWKARIIRIFALLLTAALVCYALARYLIKPLLQLRQATKQFADGNLQTRSGIKRRDEIGQLSRDFDDMAERIENLIISQKTLTRDVSHELRSPLARMNVALELAKQKSQPELENLLNRIENESFRLNEMISNILTLSKLESGTAEIVKNDINLTKIFKSVVDDSKFEADAKGKQVEILNSSNCKVYGNEQLLRSAIENVLRNAIRYTKDKVEVSLTNGGNTAKVTIRDYGQGIPEPELKQIFRPFHRVSEARDRKSGGIGLGLAITEQAVHVHNGTVSAQNTGNGLSVEISLPCENKKN